LILLSSSSATITQLLVQWSRGEQHALDALTPMVYQELRRMARRHLRRERPDHTLESTALVHEAYLRLIDQSNIQWQNRNHFFALVSELIRRILVDYARNRMAAKRGGQNIKLSLDEAIAAPEKKNLDLVALDDALQELAARDPRQSRIVELRYFGGLTLETTADVLGISLATVKRDWLLAKAFLKRELTRSAG
jgi:RNA polymerase sigma factor (TIGR02999 family)